MIEVEEQGSAEAKKERGLPIGKAAELEAAKETLPAIEVKNHVLWVNPDFPELPFNIEEGESTKLGMFLTRKPKDEKLYRLERTGTRHGRSVLVVRAVFEDKEGRLYRDVDSKGSGPTGGNWGNWIEPMEKKESAGILNLAAAYYDKDISEEFYKEGIRAHRVIAIIGLDEIIDREGNKISVKEARESGLIAESSSPVIEIRAFGTKARFEDTHVFPHDKNEELLLDDARMLVAQELGLRPEEFTKLDYIKWLAATIGKNIGLMHKNYWHHGFFLSGHNTTLDGRFVDFDSVEKLNPKDKLTEEKLLDDAWALQKALVDLIIHIGAEFYRTNKQTLLEIFNKEYEKARGPNS
ncbi:MAG: hypothetical protein Q7R94_00215 [bacterium]|nr:hypothetical protein [bacterium]